MCIFIASMHVCMYTHKHVNMRQQYSITFDIWMDYVVFFFQSAISTQNFHHHTASRHVLVDVQILDLDV